MGYPCLYLCDLYASYMHCSMSLFSQSMCSQPLKSQLSSDLLRYSILQSTSPISFALKLRFPWPRRKTHLFMWCASDSSIISPMDCLPWITSNIVVFLMLIFLFLLLNHSIWSMHSMRTWRWMSPSLCFSTHNQNRILFFGFLFG